MAGSDSKNRFFSSRQPPHDSVSSGNFPNLKFTAEKLVKELASMKSDLHWAPRIVLLRFRSLLSIPIAYPVLFLLSAFISFIHELKRRNCRMLSSWGCKRRMKSFGEGWSPNFLRLTLCVIYLLRLCSTSQIQQAEKDKERFEFKFSTSAQAINSLKQQMKDLSVKLSASEENIKSREKELEELQLEKGQKENSYQNEQCRTASFSNEKDAMINNSDAAIAEAKLNIENLNFQIEKVRLELTSKEDEGKYLVGVKEKLEQENMNIQLSADNLSEYIEAMIRHCRDIIKDDKCEERAVHGNEVLISDQFHQALLGQKKMQPILIQKDTEILAARPDNLANYTALPSTLPSRISLYYAEMCLSEERFELLKKSEPQGQIGVSDTSGRLYLFWTPRPLDRKHVFKKRQVERREVVAGYIRDQLFHALCWAYSLCDMVSASLVLHGWEKEFIPLCPRYLCEKVRPDLRVGVCAGCWHTQRADPTFNCNFKRASDPEEDLYRITDVFKYETMEQALVRLKSHPVAAKLTLFEGWSSDRIYRGPSKKGAGYIGEHEVLMLDCVLMDGEMVVRCKSSNGERIGVLGYIFVSLEVMFLLAGKDDSRFCFKEPQYLINGFFSIGMDTGPLGLQFREKPNRKKRNLKKFKVVLEQITTDSESSELGMMRTEHGSMIAEAMSRVGRKETSTIVGDGTTQEAVQKHLTQIKNLIEQAEQDYEKEKLSERIATLSGGVAVIQVGAQTEPELKEKKLRVEYALNAKKAAVEDGIVVGGGCTLLRLASKVDTIKAALDDDEEKVGTDIVKRALSYPLNPVAKNAGVSGSIVSEKVLSNENVKFGYNAATGKYEDLMAAGIIDPTKVVRCCLEHAASVAKTFLMSDCVVVEIKEPEPVPTGNPMDNSGNGY
ncbi:hypothetical protein Bca52824_063903 [Brassica carinata]|uniref:RuBisCO large subunit-binding protein subunit beta, chloroplastic n=1 Tax=Brassica carinata TaxID=52824 RepID=A0A8X7QGI3_BRACI|nr:hypothetical protein Bca52824_063903 [Brassica carinata]